MLFNWNLNCWMKLILEKSKAKRQEQKSKQKWRIRFVKMSIILTYDAVHNCYVYFICSIYPYVWRKNSSSALHQKEEEKILTIMILSVWYGNNASLHWLSQIQLTKVLFALNLIRCIICLMQSLMYFNAQVIT